MASPFFPPRDRGKLKSPSVQEEFSESSRRPTAAGGNLLGVLTGAQQILNRRSQRFEDTIEPARACHSSKVGLVFRQGRKKPFQNRLFGPDNYRAVTKYQPSLEGEGNGEHEGSEDRPRLFVDPATVEGMTGSMKSCHFQN